MLKERVITAVFLVLGFLLCLFVLPWQGFAIAIGAVLSIGAWEWANLAGLKNTITRLAYVLAVALVAVFAGWYSRWFGDIVILKMLLLVACIWWAIALLWVQGYPASAVLWQSVFIRMLMGVCVLMPAWLACLFLRREEQGAWLVLFVVFIVAAADIGAYFSGRAFGRIKLAPSVSPGKSWEGVIGGACLALVIAGLFNVFMNGQHWVALLIIVAPTAFVSVLGDLLESMMKRHRGVKDSSQLLPGHGGVLDRVDALVAALPIFALLYISSEWRV